MAINRQTLRHLRLHKPTCLSSSSSTSASIVFPRIASAIEDSIVWDSVYFVRIASAVFALFIPLVGYRAVLGLSGYVISNIAFVLAALCLYRCISVGVWANNVGTLLLALSGAARSNGVINAGYTCYQTMHTAYDAVFHRRSFVGSGFSEILPTKTVAKFLLASPILSLALGSIIHYVKLQPEIFLSLGFLGSSEDKNSASMFSPMGADRRAKGSYSLKERTSTIQQEDQILRRRKQTIKGDGRSTLPVENDSSDSSRNLSVAVLPFILHLGFMAATAFFVMHVQIWSGGRNSFLISQSTSLLVCCPFNGISHKQEEMGILDMAYSAAYILLGSLLFSNFYPFT
ncbi:hypothetical protein C3L33_05774, partial [Rhododendron williamsianum]